MVEDSSYKTILSHDGGFVRGLISAALNQSAEVRLPDGGRPHHTALVARFRLQF